MPQEAHIEDPPEQKVAEDGTTEEEVAYDVCTKS
jgi:hypothetical protein